MGWSEAYKMTKDGKLWGFLDIARNFTDETIMKQNLLSNTIQQINIMP